MKRLLSFVHLLRVFELTFEFVIVFRIHVHLYNILPLSGFRGFWFCFRNFNCLFERIDENRNISWRSLSIGLCVGLRSSSRIAYIHRIVCNGISIESKKPQPNHSLHSFFTISWNSPFLPYSVSFLDSFVYLTHRLRFWFFNRYSYLKNNKTILTIRIISIRNFSFQHFQPHQRIALFHNEEPWRRETE